ncbi:MAG: phosphate ABC transporter substrate-binding protein, partial [Dehalococcoidia bacterium]|nr:phosphate ABC transporter substrate-binding protein [Dehalococcoidia bacterium]
LSGNITIKGSDTMVNLGARWAEGFMKEHSKVSISVTGGGSGTGIAALINKTTDICQASRSMTAQEIANAQKNGVNPVEFIVALDGLSVVVNPSNAVNELNFQQLSDIYTGKITNWKDVGGKDASILVLSRDTNSGTHVFFKEHVVQMAGMPAADKKLEYGSKVLMMASSKTGIEEVSGNANAIFYVGLGYVTDKVKALNIKKTASDTAIGASVQTVKDGSYPVARPLFFYTNGQPQGTTKAFIDWAMGAEGQKIVLELDFVNIN